MPASPTRVSIALRQPHDEVVRRGRLGRRGDLLLARAFRAVGDVGAMTVSSKSTGSCVSSAEAPRTLASVASRRSCPSIRMAPLDGSKKRRMRFSTVLLPAPLGPTSATFCPAAISRLKSERTGPPSS